MAIRSQSRPALSWRSDHAVPAANVLFDPITDFVPISHDAKSPFVFIVNPSLPVDSVLEFIKYAKERPGQISYSSSGIGGAPI